MWNNPQSDELYGLYTCKLKWGKKENMNCVQRVEWFRPEGPFPILLGTFQNMQKYLTMMEKLQETNL